MYAPTAFIFGSFNNSIRQNVIGKRFGSSVSLIMFAMLASQIQLF